MSVPDSNSNQPAEQQASLAAARLAAIVESSDDAIVSKTLDGTIVSWNLAAERIFGYSAAEIVGSSIYILVPPDLRVEEQQLLARIAAGEHITHYETTRIRKDGRIVPIELAVSPLRDANGTIVGASSIKRDLTERRRAAEMAARLAAVVESSEDAIVSKTLDGTIMSWNSAAERMYGYTAAEIVGSPIFRVLPDRFQAEEKQILERIARGEHVAHYETVRRRKDGTEITISLTISPIRDTAGKVIGASSIKRDITETKRLEETRRQTAKLEAIGRLAGGLAHDFNNQLHALSGFANFIGRDSSLSPSARHDLLEIQKATESMASLTRQLLAFARQQILNPETLDLNATVANLQPMLQRLIGNNMEIQLELAPGPKWVRVDRAQLAQVVMNLVINARDAMPNGGRLVVQTETLEVGPGQLFDRLQVPVEPGAYAELTVSDSGEGIAPEQLLRIFEPFYTTKDVGQGTGLGLATVEGIVSQSAGHIRVESTLGRGTTIRIMLPLAAAPAPVAPVRPDAVDRAARSRHRLLVVDDEDMVRAIVVRTLQEEGYEVLAAHHGKAAIDCVEQVGGAIDLVITDLVMPVMGGRELAAELLRRYPDLPLLWMSGHARETGLPDTEGRDQPFLQKPVTPDLLLNTVAQILQQSSSRR